MSCYQLMHLALSFLVLASIGVVCMSVPLSPERCLPEAVPDSLIDSLKPVRILVASWDSSALLGQLFSILVEERLGVATSMVDRDALYEKLAEKNPEVLNWSSTASLMAADAADIDLDNWDTAFEVNRTNAMHPNVASGINGCLAREGWYMPKYLVDMSPDLQSYISLKDPRLARIFGTNPPVNLSEAIQPLNPTTVRDTALASSACQPLAAAANASACINTVLAPVLGTQSGRGKLHVANFTFWNTYDRHILRGLGLQLDMAEINPPIETNLLQSLQTAYSQRKPWLGYLWEPHAIFSNYSGIELVRVSLPLWTNECHSKLNEIPPRMPCDYPTLFTRKVWRKQLAQELPHVYSLAEALRVNTEHMLEMLGEVTYRGVTHRQAACHWLLAHRSWWDPMVPAVQLLRPACPPGTEATKSGLKSRYWTCSRCPRGSFNLLPNSTCHTCPPGGQCPGGFAFLVQRNWYYIPNSELSNGGIPQLFACDMKSQCCMSGSCELQDVCPAGLHGSFCSECAVPGQLRWGKLCATCSSSSSMTTAATLAGMLAAITLLGVGFAAVGFDLRTRFVPDFIVFYQLAGLLLDPEDRFNTPWLSLFPSLQWISLLEALFPFATCVLVLSPLSRIGLESTFPVMVWLVVASCHALLIYLVTAHHTVLKNALPQSFQSVDKLNQLFRSRYASLLTVTYLPLVKSSMLLLNCRTMTLGHMYLAASPSVTCFTGGHIPLAILAIVVLCILVLLVPSQLIFQVFRLWRAGKLARSALKRHPQASPLPRQAQSNLSKVNVPHLCAGFKSRYIIFSAVDCLKLAINVALGVLPARTTSVERMAVPVLLLSVNWLRLFLNYLRKPMRQSLDNHLRAVTLGCIMMLSGSGLVRFQDSTNSAAIDPSPFRSTYIAFFTVQPLLLLPWYLIRQWLVRTKARRRFKATMISTRSIMWPGTGQPADASDKLQLGGDPKSAAATGSPQDTSQSGKASPRTSIALNQTLLWAYLWLGEEKDLEVEENGSKTV